MRTWQTLLEHGAIKPHPVYFPLLFFIAKLVSSLSDSEQKILTYETEIAILRGDMFKMERNLQDDINSLTMKNSLLRSLLEAINEHGENHKDGENSEQSATDLSTTSAASNHKMAEDRSNTQLTHHNDISNDSVITTHINRLPQEIQVGVQILNALCLRFINVIVKAIGEMIDRKYLNTILEIF